MTVNHPSALGAKTWRDEKGALCVMFDNSPVKGFFYDNPGTVYESDPYFSVELQRDPFNYALEQYEVRAGWNQNLTTNLPKSLSTPYQLGDFVTTYYPAVNSYGNLMLPAPSFSGLCNDLNPMSFLQSETVSCSRPLYTATGDTNCVPGGFLDVGYYISGVQIVTGNNATLDFANTTCIEPFSSNITSCLGIPPNWDAPNQACYNMATSVRYIFTYDLIGATPGGGSKLAITNVSLEVGFTDLLSMSSAAMVRQTFEVAWVQNLTSPLPRSGNPGYIHGLPVLTGAIVTSPAPAIAYFSSPLDGLTYPIDVPISLFSRSVDLDGSSDGIEQIKSPYPSALGCSRGGQTTGGTPDRVPVTFGEDVAGGCTLHLSRRDLGDCVAVRALARDSLTGGGRMMEINRIGKFGNANASVTGEWASIIVENVGDKTGSITSPNACSGVLTSVDIQFLTTPLGSDRNPQSAIVGARFVYTYGLLTYRCLHPADCATPLPGATNATQRFRLRSTVTFFEVPGTQARPYVPPPPALIPTLPDDLFYPFRIG
ncbi:Tectonic-3, partial [Irineochytrium annulatum]